MKRSIWSHKCPTCNGRIWPDSWEARKCVPCDGQGKIYSLRYELNDDEYSLLLKEYEKRKTKLRNDPDLEYGKYCLKEMENYKPKRILTDKDIGYWSFVGAFSSCAHALRLSWISGEKAFKGIDVEVIAKWNKQFGYYDVTSNGKDFE